MTEKMTYDCPVCGYNKLRCPPVDFFICCCCGTEFGNDDFDVSHQQLREQWIQSGMSWFSEYTLPSPQWNPTEQLRLRDARPTNVE